LRMAAYSFKQKMYSRTAPPPGQGLYTNVNTKGSAQAPKQYENYGYGYEESQFYDPNTYAQGAYAQNAYNYYQAGYGYDYSGAYVKADGTQPATPLQEYTAPTPTANSATVVSSNTPSNQSGSRAYNESQANFVAAQPQTRAAEQRNYNNNFTPQTNRGQGQQQTGGSYQQQSSNRPSFASYTSGGQTSQNWAYSGSGANSAPPGRGYSAQNGSFGSQGNNYVGQGGSYGGQGSGYNTQGGAYTQQQYNGQAQGYRAAYSYSG